MSRSIGPEPGQSRGRDSTCSTKVLLVGKVNKVDDYNADRVERAAGGAGGADSRAGEAGAPASAVTIAAASKTPRPAERAAASWYAPGRATIRSTAGPTSRAVGATRPT